ncbi:MAG: hypothetical protein ABR502_03070 [Chitinophagaceae bacterium]
MKNNQFSFIVISIVFAAITACNNDRDPTYNLNATLPIGDTTASTNTANAAGSSEVETSATIVDINNPEGGGVNPPHGEPGHICGQAVGAPLPASSNIAPPIAVAPVPIGITPSAGNKGKLNPAHGQPGHRCDIAEGASLNSAPAKPATSTNTTTPTINTPSAIKISPGNKNLNPAHGQPGHRCDISVGAPLNSAPAQKTTIPSINNTTTPVVTDSTSSATNNPVAVTLPAATPIVNFPFTIPDNIVASGTPAATSGNVKLNPAHGQPGHDCKIAVGQPLKQ